MAGYLRDNDNEIIVKVMDCKFDRISMDEAEKLILKGQYDLVAFTAMTNEIKAAAKLAKRLKKTRANLLTVIGGVHVTALPKMTLEEFPCFDYIVIGEGEETFLKLIRHFKLSTPIPPSGVAYRKNGSIVVTGPAVSVSDQDSINPAWDMFSPAKEYVIQSSRGCPFACNFCMNPGGRVVRPRAVKTTLDEIGYILDKFKPESIYFGDEIFTVKRGRAREICEGLIARGYHKRISWWCQTHVNTLDRELVRIMKKAGCRLVGLGIETGDEEVFRKMGKGINKEKIKKTIKLLNEEELKYDTMFILGQPNETVNSAQKTIDFAVELNPTTPIFGLMVPYPGTKVGEMALRGEGGYKLLSRDWDQFNKQIGNALELEGITRKQLERIQFLGYLKVFLYNLRFVDFFVFCLQYRKEGFASLRKILLGS
ncbi:MAG: hypothetical protein CME62_03195 [Halobacteriovoraceae bacterium]|nr:hypothetical protein [Halobacteriovoraceae bacterium]